MRTFIYAAVAVAYIAAMIVTSGLIVGSTLQSSNSLQADLATR